MTSACYVDALVKDEHIEKFVERVEVVAEYEKVARLTRIHR